MAQPPPSRLSLRGFLSLPVQSSTLLDQLAREPTDAHLQYRLCNPPPAVGKVRSCGVTPVLDVRLDDVLARRHLPPIGLKDFEEFLLYVEHAPENLYFILWLKDYTSRYQAWVQREKVSLVTRKDKLASRSNRHHSNFSVPPTPDPSLAMFYLRAKQTFFTPNGEFELNIPSDILAPFHATHPSHTQSPDRSRASLWHSQSVHPDPAVFAEVAIEARNMLNESLKRFVRAAYTNVGSGRAVCGITAGCVITLAAGVLPLVMTTGRWNLGPHGHLIRLSALPGLWFGLTVFIASLQGVCLMIYFFGDLRQLRKFELSRPTISRPMPLPNISPPIPSKSAFLPSRPAPAPLQEKCAAAPSSPMSSLDSPISFIAPPRPSHALSSTSLIRGSYDSSRSDVFSPEGRVEIDVSPAFFDDVPAPEGPATASCLYRPEYRTPPSSLAYIEPVHTRPDARPRDGGAWTPRSAAGGDPTHHTRSPRSVRHATEYGPTAGFIPNGYNHSTTSLSETTRSLRSQKSACYFDFDALPPSRVGHHHHRHRLDNVGGGDGASTMPHRSVLPMGVVVEPSTVGQFFGRAQYKCNQHTTTTTTTTRYPSCDKSSFSDTSSIHRSRRRAMSFLTMLIPSFTAGVPAFATPLTEVQSPVVKRAQWEVVIRGGLVAAVIAGTVTGIIVGVVP